MYLKRLFVGSISLSDDSQTLGENGGTAPERQEADGGQSSGSAHISLQVLSWRSSTSHLRKYSCAPSSTNHLEMWKTAIKYGFLVCKTLLILILPFYFSSSVEESSTEGGTEGEQTGGDGESKGEEESGISAPLVLSQERLEEVQRRLQSIEEQLKRLQVRRNQFGKEYSVRSWSGGENLMDWVWMWVRRISWERCPY